MLYLSNKCENTEIIWIFFYSSVNFATNCVRVRADTVNNLIGLPANCNCKNMHIHSHAQAMTHSISISSRLKLNAWETDEERLWTIKIKSILDSNGVWPVCGDTHTHTFVFSLSDLFYSNFQTNYRKQICPNLAVIEKWLKIHFSW